MAGMLLFIKAEKGFSCAIQSVPFASSIVIRVQNDSVIRESLFECALNSNFAITFSCVPQLSMRFEVSLNAQGKL
jgi:hypothetical protein